MQSYYLPLHQLSYVHALVPCWLSVRARGGLPLTFQLFQRLNIFLRREMVKEGGADAVQRSRRSFAF